MNKGAVECLGGSATTTSKTLTFADENPFPVLWRLRVDYPNSSVYLSGAIGVDAPEDLELEGLNPKGVETFGVSGGNVVMSYQGLEGVIALLGEQYVTGTLTVKGISGGRRS